jgi:two-component system response regulator QseB
MLPEQDGLIRCALRESGSAVPVIMPRRATPDARIQGLDVGADDYLTKRTTSVSCREAARAHPRGRRPLLLERLAVGSIVLDTRSRTAWVRSEVTLTGKNTRSWVSAPSRRRRRQPR